MVPRLQPACSMRWVAISCAAAIACSGSGEPAETADGPPPIDAAPGQSGLTLEFRTDKPLPADLGDDLEIHEIDLTAQLVRAIGDATTENEESTTRRGFTLRWDRDAAPEPIVFGAAPTGAYAYVEIRMTARTDGAGPRDSFEIRGEARVQGDRKRFVIEGELPVVAMVPVSRQLEAGRPIAIPIELSLRPLVESIDFDDLPENNGTVYLDDRRPMALRDFSQTLAAAFRAN